MPFTRRELARTALCTWATFHVAGILVANLPRTTALGSVLHRPFEGYLAVFGLFQTWDMFTTIPRFASLDGTLVAVGADGKERRYGPVLPGLVPAGESARIKGTFLRLAFSSAAYAGYSERYLSALCHAIRDKEGIPPTSVRFELLTEQVRKLEDVRRDGVRAEPKTFTFGPAECTR
jgi:hypothetical protein